MIAIDNFKMWRQSKWSPKMWHQSISQLFWHNFDTTLTHCIENLQIKNSPNCYNFLQKCMKHDSRVQWTWRNNNSKNELKCSKILQALLEFEDIINEIEQLINLKWLRKRTLMMRWNWAMKSSNWLDLNEYKNDP